MQISNSNSNAHINPTTQTPHHPLPPSSNSTQPHDNNRLLRILIRFQGYGVEERSSYTDAARSQEIQRVRGENEARDKEMRCLKGRVEVLEAILAGTDF